METQTLINPEITNKPAIIVGLVKGAEHENVDGELDELESLLMTLGVKTAARVVQRRWRLSPSHLIGQGKIEEVAKAAKESGARLVVIDHPLSGPQVRNLELMTNCQVLDRAGVILDIFARHAKTNQAKTQVEIAQLEYLLPRLAGAWTHFQRQTGGGVRARGMGEKQIEVDRRRARERISRLHKRLEHIRKERETQRKARRNELKVALVGYTNSGKTTIMSGLTKASTVGVDKLFATLDASVRVLDPATRPKILLSDTVGFIRNLPHGLVASFKSTLEEVRSADLLLHVVDVSHADYQQQMETTHAVLEEIGAGDLPTIIAFNKMDHVEETFLARILEKKYPGSLVMSAHSMEDILRLRQHMFEYFETGFHELHLQIPSSDQGSLSLVYQNCVILDGNYETPDFASFHVRAPARVLGKLQKFASDPLKPAPSEGKSKDKDKKVLEGSSHYDPRKA